MLLLLLQPSYQVKWVQRCPTAASDLCVPIHGFRPFLSRTTSSAHEIDVFCLFAYPATVGPGFPSTASSAGAGAHRQTPRLLGAALFNKPNISTEYREEQRKLCKGGQRRKKRPFHPSILVLSFIFCLVPYKNFSFCDTE